MKQQGTNDLAILNIHRDIAFEIDLEDIVDQFIYQTV